MLRNILILCILFVGLQQMLKAQEADKDSIVSYANQEEVVITALRTASDPLNTAHISTVLTNRELLENNPRSVAEALIGFTGVWMQKTAHGAGSPFVRGLTGNQTLLLIDGIRLNNSTYRYGPNQYFNTIDPLTIDHIEVTRGTGSVQYGSDALGGAVHVLTYTPEFSNQSDWGATLQGRIMSDNMDKSTRISLNYGSKNFAATGGFSYKDFGDLVAGGDLGTLKPSSYDERDADLKLRFRAGEKHEFTAAYQWVLQMNLERFDQISRRDFLIDKFDPQERRLAYLKWQWNIDKPWLQEIRATASHQTSIEGRESLRKNQTSSLHEQDDVYTQGYIVEVISRPNDNWEIVSGAEWYYDLVRSSAYRENLQTKVQTNQRGLYPDNSKAFNSAIFTLHSYKLNKFTLQAGLRYNTFSLQYSDETFGEVNIKPSALVGNVGLLYRLAPTQSIAASLSSGFRSPNINDISTFGRFDNGVEVPSDELDPERTLTYELSYKARAGRWKGYATIYYMQIQDLITRVRSTYQGSDVYEGDPVFKKENTSEAYIYGAEAEVTFSILNNLELHSGITYTYGQDESRKEPLRRMPPLNGRTGLTLRTPKGFWARLETVYASEQDRLAAGDKSDHRIGPNGTPGWTVLNAQAGYFKEKYQVSLGLQNLFDEAYRLHGSGVDGYGRSIWAAVRWML